MFFKVGGSSQYLYVAVTEDCLFSLSCQNKVWLAWIEFGKGQTCEIQWQIVDKACCVGWLVWFFSLVAVHLSFFASSLGQVYFKHGTANYPFLCFKQSVTGYFRSWERIALKHFNEGKLI